MSELERAVIEAARALARQAPDVVGRDDVVVSLCAAVSALDAAGTPGEHVVDWRQVAEGDQLLSVNNGNWYRVVRTAAVRDGKTEITISLGTIPKTIVRPTEKEPTATVRRGPTGRAVQAFVDVFVSGVGR